jgi:hypothetical protein
LGTGEATGGRKDIRPRWGDRRCKLNIALASDHGKIWSEKVVTLLGNILKIGIVECNVMPEGVQMGKICTAHSM